MPVTMIWNIAAEKKPAHEEGIVWLRVTSGFDSWGFEPREDTVEYQWVEVDEDGDTGSAVCYEHGDEMPDDGYYRLAILVGGWELQETDLWMSIDDYDKFLRENIPALRN